MENSLSHFFTKQRITMIWFTHTISMYWQEQEKIISTINSLDSCISYDSKISLLWPSPKKLKPTKIYTIVFADALFKIAEKWMGSKCPLCRKIKIFNGDKFTWQSTIHNKMMQSASKHNINETQKCYVEKRKPYRNEHRHCVSFHKKL
jgi:hypothetical protein